MWQSLELAKVAPALLEYVVVHELIHLLERAHNRRFRELLASTCRRGGGTGTS